MQNSHGEPISDKSLKYTDISLEYQKMDLDSYTQGWHTKILQDIRYKHQYMNETKVIEELDVEALDYLLEEEKCLYVL